MALKPSLRARILVRIHQRLVGLFVRHGLLEHPRGKRYVKQRYTVLGRRRENESERQEPQS